MIALFISSESQASGRGKTSRMIKTHFLLQQKEENINH